MKTLKTRLEYEGQCYVDDPIYNTIMPTSFLMRASLASAFGSQPPEPLNILTGYERVKLRWMKPGPDGKLMPR